MNSQRDFVRSSFPAPLSRAGLPVVSNRAFIQAWAARRRLPAKSGGTAASSSAGLMAALARRSPAALPLAS